MKDEESKQKEKQEPSRETTTTSKLSQYRNEDALFHQYVSGVLLRNHGAVLEVLLL